MKLTRRIATVFLSLVMLLSLLPLGTMVSAATIEKEAFYMVNSSDDGDVPYIYDMPEITTTHSKIKDSDISNSCSGYDSTFIEDIAAEMKDDFDARPEGTRYFELKMFRTAVEALNESVVYWDDAVEVTKEWLTEYLKEYKKIGGKLDGIIMDIEFEHLHGTYIYDWVYKGNVRNGVPANQNIYKDIVNDPRYQTEIRPMLVERGFKFWENPTGDESEIWTINDGFSLNSKLKTDKYWRIWLNVMNLRMAEAANEAVYEPLQKYFPGAILSDYQMADNDTWQKQLDQYADPATLNTSKIGNTSNFNAYNYAVNDSVPGNKTPVGYNKAVYGDEPFDMTLWDVNMFKKMYEATDTGLVNAWVAGYNNKYGQAKVFSNVNTPYYTETMLHMGLLNMSPSFLGYVIPKEEAAAGNDFKTSMLVISDILAELTRVAGASDRKAISTPVSWNGEYILSGMYAGGRNIWRITPNTNVISVKDFKVKDKAPTFSVEGQTVVFPQGRIIKDGSIRAVGTCGYWVETPANVMPVITSTTDRYAKYPAYEENFQQYSAGTTLAANTAQPKNAWKTSGTALKVQASGSNKGLAMTGTATLQNVNIPKYVTAGDSFAKQQAWEISFTLPANLGANAVLKLLMCDDNDGGIKIANGKMYYDENGTYKELSGVSLSAGTYTVKREVDFNTYKSSYAIYSSNGALLKEVKNVAMADVSVLEKVAAPKEVFAIEMACENVNNAIFVDNYKLYPTGVTTEFSLYDAKIGTQLTNLNEVRTKDTAYRLSWMNTSNENKVAYVYNVKNGAIIKKVEMPAGQDGVVAGVVQANSGAAVQLAVKTENGTATALPNYDNGDFSWPTMTENFGKPIGGGSAGTVTPPTTNPTTPPTTNPGTSPETDPTTPAVTNPDATDPSVTDPDVTDPSTTDPNMTDTSAPSITAPDDGNQPSGGDTTEPDTDKGLTGGQIAGIATAGVATAGGGGAALLYVFNKELFFIIVKRIVKLFRK